MFSYFFFKFMLILLNGVYVKKFIATLQYPNNSIKTVLTLKNSRTKRIENCNQSEQIMMMWDKKNLIRCILTYCSRNPICQTKTKWDQWSLLRRPAPQQKDWKKDRHKLKTCKSTQQINNKEEWAREIHQNPKA